LQPELRDGRLPPAPLRFQTVGRVMVSSDSGRPELQRLEARASWCSGMPQSTASHSCADSSPFPTLFRIPLISHFSVQGCCGKVEPVFATRAPGWQTSRPPSLRFQTVGRVIFRSRAPHPATSYSVWRQGYGHDELCLGTPVHSVLFLCRFLTFPALFHTPTQSTSTGLLQQGGAGLTIRAPGWHISPPSSIFCKNTKQLTEKHTCSVITRWGTQGGLVRSVSRNIATRKLCMRTAGP
jgi:hypothetical protein